MEKGCWRSAACLQTAETEQTAGKSAEDYRSYLGNFSVKVAQEERKLGEKKRRRKKRKEDGGGDGIKSRKY